VKGVAAKGGRGFATGLCHLSGRLTLPTALGANTGAFAAPPVLLQEEGGAQLAETPGMQQGGLGWAQPTSRVHGCVHTHAAAISSPWWLQLRALQPLLPPRVHQVEIDAEKTREKKARTQMEEVRVPGACAHGCLCACACVRVCLRLCVGLCLCDSQ